MQPVATNTAIAAKNRLSCISGGMVVFPSPEHHSDQGYRSQGFRNSPGSLAISLASAITQPPGRGHKKQLSRLAPRKVIALANAGGDTINAVKQAAEIGISPRSQTLVPLLVLLSDVHTLGLDVAKGMTFIDGFYWDADDQTRAWSKQFFDRRKVMPTMNHAGVYSS